MKKILVVLLALAMLVSCVAIFASCGAKPQLDLEKAKDALEDADYDVSYEDDMSDYTPYIEEYLEAGDDDDNEITIIRFADTKTAKLYYQSLKLERDYDIDTLKLQIKQAKHQLKKYEDDLSSDEIDALEDEIKELEKELEDMKDDYIIGRSGKVVWVGTKDAIKAYSI